MMKADSEVIRIIRFPLAILVVFIHSFIAVEGFKSTSVDIYHLTGAGVYSLVGIGISRVIAQVAVPLFFFISGYLFFLNYGDWNWIKWKEKLRRRINTLLIPYLTWVTIAILEIIGIGLVAYIVKGRPLWGLADWYHQIGGIFGIFWNDLSHIELFSNVFGWESFMTYPLLMPMWFIRDLMVVVILTPVIWFLLKRTPHLSVILLGILWTIGVETKIPGFSLASIFMFTWGGVLFC